MESRGSKLGNVWTSDLTGDDKLKSDSSSDSCLLETEVDQQHTSAFEINTFFVLLEFNGFATPGIPGRTMYLIRHNASMETI
ncbi:hypothetical protein SCA6_018804 [Theobroma cacao]